MTVQIERVATNGIFSLDGDDFEVENNIWLVGDDDEVIIFDAAHDHRPIVAAVAGRKVASIICTHAHNDHINAAIELANETDAPVWLHPDDAMLWDAVHPDRCIDAPLTDQQVLTIGGCDITVLHTPGHSPGGCCFHVPELQTVFTGDTLFNGGPGATGRSFSDLETLIESISAKLLRLNDHTKVHTGHGDDTTIGAERAGIQIASSSLYK